MGFVVQAADRQGGGRPSYRAYSGRADNPAGGRLGAKTAVAGFRDTVYAGAGTRRGAQEGSLRVASLRTVRQRVTRAVQRAQSRPGSSCSCTPRS
jgi:hypothetical protein